MKAKLYLTIVMIAVLLFAGCRKSADKDSAEVKSKAEYKTQADKEITEENIQEELNKIEAEMKADTEN